MSDPPTRAQLEAALRASEARLGAVVANAPVILFATDQHGVFTLSEGRGRDALGLSPGEGLGLSVRDVFAGFPEVVANVERALSGHTFTATVDVADVVFETWYSPWCDTDGTVIGMIGVASEVQSFAASRAEAARAIEEARFGALVEHLADLITVLDREGRVLYASPSVMRLLGPEAGQPVWRLVHPDDLAGVRKAMTELMAEPGRLARIECRVRASNGEWRYLDSMTTNLLEDPLVRGVVCNTRDITEHKDAEAELARQAYHDDLTGLPNRALFLDRLNMALARSSRRRRGSLAVLFLDLDRFKVINDSLGHGPGDRLLEAVARRLEGALRPSDTVARFGGDEFTILCEDLTADLEPFTIAERIGRALALPFALEDREVFLTVSIGIAVATDETVGADTLLRDADAAMYRAKERGRARYEVFDEAMRSRAMERMEMEHDLHRAIDRDELTLRYQPVVDLGTGAVVGVEALLRWSHPRRGLMQPASFIPLAEETGLIVPIGEWALVEAVRQAGQWRRAGLLPDRFAMSVNLSAGQLLQPRLGQAVDEALAQAAIEPASLWLEITESTLMEDADAAIATLTRFKERGLSLSIDDFGTGFSSLSYLRRLPIDALKIDQSFVRDLGSSHEGHAIAEAVVALAHTLRLGAVAEGVETLTQLAQLRLIGCDSAQGFLFSAPSPSDAIEHLLRRQPRW